MTQLKFTPFYTIPLFTEQSAKKSEEAILSDISSLYRSVARGLHLQLFRIYRFYNSNSDPKDFISSQEHLLNNPPGHQPNGCCVS